MNINLKFLSIEIITLIILLNLVIFVLVVLAQPKPELSLWNVYQQSFKSAKYVDLTHDITPSIPVWAGFGHEPLDTDSTPTLEAEDWLLTNGYTQAEGVTNLDQVPEAGALVIIGYPKFKGGTGGYARYIAICPPNWQYGVSVGKIPESPLQKYDNPLRWNESLDIRVR